MLILSAQKRANLIQFLEVEYFSAKPPLRDICATVLALLLDYEALITAVQNRLEVVTDLASELQDFLDNSDIRLNDLSAMLRKSQNDEEVLIAANDLVEKLQAYLRESEARATADLIPGWHDPPDRDDKKLQ